MFRWVLILCILLAAGRWLYVRTVLQAHVVAKLKAIEAYAEYSGNPALDDSKFGRVVIGVQLGVPFRSDQEAERVVALLQQLPHLAELTAQTDFHSSGSTLAEREQADRHLALAINSLRLRHVTVCTRLAGQQTAEAIRRQPRIGTVMYQIGATPTEQQLATVCQALHVERLAFHGGQLTSEHLRTLATARQLRNLTLSCRYPFDELPALGKLSLCELTLDGQGVSDRELREFIAPLQNLKQLSLDCEAPSGDALAALVQSSRLRSLTLQYASVGDESVRSLVDLPALQFLNLIGTDVTEAGLAQFARCASLKELGLTATLDRDRVRSSLPDVALIWERPRPEGMARRAKRKAEADLVRELAAPKMSQP